MKRLLIALCSIVASSLAIADEVDIPNTFSAGTPAVAAEVNENFSAVETAVDDNAMRVSGLETGITQAGVAVRVAGSAIGRYLGVATGFIEVNLAPGAGGGTGIVSDGRALRSARLVHVVSPTGYHFTVATSDSGSSRVNEGDLDYMLLAYDAAACTGNIWLPVEGNTGLLSTFTPNNGDNYPIKPWFLRQGLVFASPDPADPTPAYMLRRGAAIQTVPVVSLLIYAEGLQAPFCFELANNPNYDPNDPLDVNHTVVPIEVNDPAESGVPDTLGGELTIGM